MFYGKDAMATIVDIRPGDSVENVARICNRNFKALAAQAASSEKLARNQSQDKMNEEIDSVLSKMEEDLQDAIDDMNAAMTQAIDDLEESVNTKMEEKFAEYDERLANLESIPVSWIETLN